MQISLNISIKLAQNTTEGQDRYNVGSVQDVQMYSSGLRTDPYGRQNGMTAE